MTITDESAFTSKQFTFIVEGSSFHVHAALVSDCSGPLDRMINGHLSEAHQGFALLEDVDKASFVRFVRWLYSKEYPATEHTVVEDELAPASQDGEAPTSKFDIDDCWGFSKKTKKGKKKTKEVERVTLREAFISRKYDFEDIWEPSPVPSPRSNQASNEDYTEVFLCHARLYVFAEKYDIQSLKRLALRKLQQTLAVYTLYPERVRDITSLLKYVYANTAEAKPGVEDIRTMLANYIGCEMEILVKEGEIKELLASNEEMLSDFLDMFAS